MKLVLYTVKEYCRKKRISDAGARKQIKEGRLQAVQMNGETFVAVNEDTEEKCKQRVKLLQAKVRELKAAAAAFQNQADLIDELKRKVSLLEEKLEKQRDSKEALYEKMIGTLLELPKELP